MLCFQKLENARERARISSNMHHTVVFSFSRFSDKVNNVLSVQTVENHALKEQRAAGQVLVFILLLVRDNLSLY